MSEDFFSRAAELRRQGRPFATATVVRAERPTSGKPGDKAIITLDGEVFGWVGGSCAEPTVVQEARQALAEDASRLLRLAPEMEEEEREGVTERPMTCYSGGAMDIFVEPHPPRLRLLVAGRDPVARALSALAGVMGYEVVAVDPEGAGVQGVERVVTDLDALREEVSPLTFAVVATHGRYDEAALAALLQARPRWVGLVASRARAAAVIEDLRRRGVGEEALEALESPAGLDLGARTGEEIALSILARVVEVRRGLEGLEWEEQQGERQAAAPDAEAPARAVDPVCGMTVETAGAPHRHTHQGVTYYFCCRGCLSRFADEPEKYLSAASS
jgi:xanthine dehydrogenase accessory factor